MNENEKAAIAAGLFDPDKHEQCGGCTYSILGMQHTHYNCGGPCRHGKWDPHEVGAPDMHDPANLWRALENTRLVYKVQMAVIYEYRTPLKDALLSALVALYDAENPEINR